MTFLNDLAHGEIIVLSGLIALTMFVTASCIGAVVAFLATREPARAPKPKPVAQTTHPVPTGLVPTTG
jgi:hypothetical protein